MIREIYDYVKELTIIDTHEHLPAFESKRDHNDIISEFLGHYYNVDLVSAGLSLETCELVKGNTLSVKEKWDYIKHYWDVCKFTGYGQSLRIAARDLYGISEICDSTIEDLNEAYKKSFEENHYDIVLKEKSKIKKSILDIWGYEEVDSRYFIAANRIDRLINPQKSSDIAMIEKITGIMITSFEKYLEACKKRIDQYYSVSKILKLGSAYERTLEFSRAAKHEAESAFNKLSITGPYFAYDQNLSNYLLHFILEYAQEKGMVLQIHTGIQEGHGNMLRNSAPGNLNSLFLEYPNMKFDLFHIGYPYQNELGSLCKMFPNVYVDMCWAHIVSPVAARNTLSEWLELFSYKKISGFGGDYQLIDGVYGHQYIARRNIAQVLSEKVENGLFEIEDACHIAKAILFDNPSELFEI